MDKEQFLEAIVSDLRTLLESNSSQLAQVNLTFSVPLSGRPVMIQYDLKGQHMASVARVTGRFHEIHIFEDVRFKDALIWPIVAKEMNHPD